MVSEKISKNFSYCYIKIHFFFLLLVELLSMHDFITSCTDHLESISLLNFSDLPCVDILHYMASNYHVFVSITSDLNTKILD